MRTKPFVMGYREVAQDGRLSLEARGLFMLMTSLPDSWRYTVAGLAKMAGCGRGRLRRMLEEWDRSAPLRLTFGGAGAPFLPEWGRGRNVSALSIEFFGESW